LLVSRLRQSRERTRAWNWERGHADWTLCHGKLRSWRKPETPQAVIHHMRNSALFPAFALMLLPGCGGGGNDAPATVAPSITSQPVAATVTAPGTASFSVTATGSSPLSYQWRRNGVDVAGATSAAYQTPPTAPADNGASYTVVVSNTAGTVASAAALLSVSPPPPGALTNESLVHESITRTYLKYTPVSLPVDAVPLVIVLHGGSDDAASAASAARASSAWRDVADLERFLVLYPDGLSNQWRDCRSDATVRSTANDVGFVEALIARTAATRAIDLTRVYVTGPSNGGMMSLRIGLELADRIAGIGAVIANNPVDPLTECRAATRPITVAIVNGTLDPLMPFGGGTVAFDTGRGTVRGAIETRDYWVSVNGCSTAPTSESLADLDTTDNSTVIKQSFSGCREGKRVVFFRVDGGGHTMPSRRYLELGRQNRDIEGAVEIWNVLKDSRR
jgi:polyhydroxybutyrate depolymerase